MSFAPLDRAALTKVLFDLLATGVAPNPVGRGVAPPKGGWESGTSGQGQFTDYAVLKTGRSQTPAPGHPERMARHGTSWQCLYQVTYHSVNESSVDTLARPGRNTLVTFDGQVTLDGIDWTVQDLSITEMGATMRDDTTSPAHWTVTDVVSLTLSRVQSR